MPIFKANVSTVTTESLVFH